MDKARCCFCLHALLEMPVKREREESEEAEEAERREGTKFKSMVSQRYDSHEVSSQSA